jgi:hypothetical protein
MQATIPVTTVLTAPRAPPSLLQAVTVTLFFPAQDHNSGPTAYAVAPTDDFTIEFTATLAAAPGGYIATAAFRRIRFHFSLF